MNKQEFIDCVRNLTSRTHQIVVEGNKIKGIKLIRSRSFASFLIIFLQNGQVSVHARKVTQRFQPKNQNHIKEFLVGFEII